MDKSEIIGEKAVKAASSRKFAVNPVVGDALSFNRLHIHYVSFKYHALFSLVHFL